MTILPTIMLRESYRRSDDHGLGFIYRRSDDHSDGFGRFCSPTIRRSHLGFFPESYRRSVDHNWVFFAKVTDDPTITFRFFCRKLPTIRRSLPTIRRSSFTDDPTIIFLIIFTDDPTIIWKIFTDDPTIMNMVFLAKSYRRSDDHDMDFLAKVTDDPTNTVFNFVHDSCQKWNPVQNWKNTVLSKLVNIHIGLIEHYTIL